MSLQTGVAERTRRDVAPSRWQGEVSLGIRDDLDQLHAEIAICRRCAEAGYPIQGRPILGGDGPRRVMLVGQAPGRREADGGQAFMGPAGRRLFAWLARIGIDETDFRQQVYVTAVTKCYPGPSPGGHGDRLPSTAERALCRLFLDRQVELVDPSLVILVGQLAIETMLGKIRLADAVGRGFERDGRGWLPLPHPSGASTWLNQPTHQALLSRALALLHKSNLIQTTEAAPPISRR
ncbi:MAG: uracil-DNA glycosylase [Dehalococcoidia bacterium]|nr:uracil-DNA glycosylase [Dehalococcoidia bacterium]